MKMPCRAHNEIWKKKGDFNLNLKFFFETSEKTVLCHSSSSPQKYLLSSGFSWIGFQNKHINTTKYWQQEMAFGCSNGEFAEHGRASPGWQASGELNSQGITAVVGLVLVHLQYRTSPCYPCRGFGGGLVAMGSCCLVRDGARAVCPPGGRVDRGDQR